MSLTQMAPKIAAVEQEVIAAVEQEAIAAVVQQASKKEKTSQPLKRDISIGICSIILYNTYLWARNLEWRVFSDIFKLQRHLLSKEY